MPEGVIIIEDNMNLYPETYTKTSEPAIGETRFFIDWSEDSAAYIESSGRLIKMGRKLMEILGINAVTSQGFSARLLVAKEYRSIWDDAYDRMMIKGRGIADVLFSLDGNFSFRGQVSLIRNDSFSGTFEGYYLIIDNICKPQTENSLLTDYEAKVLDSLSSHIAVVNQEGIIVSVNKPWAVFEDEKTEAVEKLLPGSELISQFEKQSGIVKERAFEFSQMVKGILEGSSKEAVIELSQYHLRNLKWFKMNVSPLELKGDRFALVTRNDVTERKKAEIELKANEKKFRSMVANSSDLTTIVDAKGVILYNSPSIEKILGFTQFERIGQSVFDLIHPDDFEKISKLMRENLGSHGVVVSAEFWIRKSDDTYICMEAIAKNLLKDPDIGGVVINSRDITDRKYNEQMLQAALTEKEALLREVHHRVKNNLQLVSSLLTLQQNHIHDESFKSIFRESMNRIKALSLMHQRLFSENNFSHIDFGHYIESIVHNLRDTYGTEKKNIKFFISADSILLNLETAVPCGLLINEILTNSIRHAFRSKDSGEIRIDLRSAGDIVLTISDNGCGFGPGFDPAKIRSLGFQLINTLSSQLNSDIEVENKNGAKFTIKFSNLNYKERGVN